MSVNLFFATIFAMLIGMFVYFEPSYVGNQKREEIPSIELESFTLYEISKNGIDHVLQGHEGKRFEDRYELASATFTDNTQHLSQLVTANNVIYKGDVIDLKGSVNYRREDGLRFQSQEGEYNTRTSVVLTRGPFTITQNANRIDGEQLHFNTASDEIAANDIRIVYHLQ